MRFKERIISFAASLLHKQVVRSAKKAVYHQEKWRLKLIAAAQKTEYGVQHGFDQITDYTSFTQQVPLVNYNHLQPWMERVCKGEKNILWPQKPLYIAKTSGTTGDFKYIPISRKGMPYHIKAARNALACYISQTKNTAWLRGKMLFLQGSPKLETVNQLKTGRLSGIVAHYVPSYLQGNRMPSPETNCMENWDTKTSAIIAEMKNQNMTLFAGIPSWLLQFFEKQLQLHQKTNLSELYPNVQVLVHGGVNFSPYKKKFEALFGKPVDVIETYPATEGFIAFQNDIREKGLLLNTHAGMFFEFIELKDYVQNNFNRIWLKDVELEKNYVLVLNTNSGLFGYVIGDTVQFVSLDPYKIIVTGRIKEYVSAFGEQVYAHQTDGALSKALMLAGGVVSEYHVYPHFSPDEKPRHVWLIEFEQMPDDLEEFSNALDTAMHEQNIYYRDIVLTGVIRPLKIKSIPKNGFYSAMQKAGKVGEQNKVPKLCHSDDFAKWFD